MPTSRLALVALILGSLAPAATHAAETVVEKDLIYGKAGDVKLKLDLARPKEGEGPFPAIVFIHGGGWHAGNRNGYLGACEEAARRGYVAVTITYRLMQFDQSKKETTTATTIFPAQIHDAKAAVRWLRANAERYHIDESRIGVTGGSAGGHLSLLVGLTDEKSGLEGESGNADESSRVQAVVNIYGPADMASCYDGSSVAWIFRLFLDGTPKESAELYKTSSPTTYITNDDPPVLTIHGDQDALVPIQQAKLLDEKMKAAGVSHTLLVMAGQGHGFDKEHHQQAQAAMWEFFAKHLRP